MKKCLASYKCAHCSKNFKNERCLKRHVKASHTERKQCNVCGNSFSTEKQVQRHIQKEHEAEVLCTACGNVFKNKKSLRKHSKYVCGKNNAESENVTAKQFEKRPLVQYEDDSDSDISESEVVEDKVQCAKQVKIHLKCADCPKTYSSSRGLRAHKKKFHGPAHVSTALVNDEYDVIIINGKRYVLEDVNIDIAVNTEHSEEIE